MQQIERYGIIALLFLVVSIVVVALWDPEPGGAGEETAQASQGNTVAAAGRQPVTQRAQNPARPQRQDSPSRFSDRASAPATGSRGVRVAQSTSAPLDLGNEANGRRRGRNSNRSEQQASSSRPPLPVAAAPSYSGAGTPTREKTRTNAGARRSAESLEAQRAADLAAGRRSRSNAQARTADSSVAQSKRTPAPKKAAQAPRETPAKAALVSASTRRVTTPTQPARATYVVRSGDSLERIARRELGDGSRWREVAELNGIANPNLVRVGQKLAMPGSKAPAPKPEQPRAKQAPAAPATTGGIYVVAKGDVLSRIAERELGSSKRWREIVALNPGLKPAKLYVGKKLKMPARGSQPAAPRRAAQPAPSTRVAQGPPAAQDDSRFVVH